MSKEFNYITLQQSSSKLDEVQVQAYGKTSRRLSVGTINSISSAEISKQPTNNPLLALQGRVPNLVITPQSGRPGAGVNMQLRGQNSLARDPNTNRRILTQPLIIVDGVPFVNNIGGVGSDVSIMQDVGTISSLSFINAAEIESIDVLSDASSTSIYGSRGGNGVILITTKRGKEGATSINANVNVGYSDIPTHVDMLNTEEYLSLRKEAYRNDFQEVPNFATPASSKDLSNYDLTLWDQNRYTDWQEVFLGGHAQDYRANLAISGGTSLIQYRVSGGYLDQGNVLPGPYKNQSGNGQINLNGNSANGKLNVNITGGYTFSLRSNPSSDLTSRAFRLAPNAPSIFKDNGELNWEPDPRTGKSTWINGNPYAQLLRATNEKTNQFLSSGMFNYRLSDKLMLKMAAGLNRTDFNSIFMTPIESFDPSTVVTARGSAQHNASVSTTWNIEPQVFYNTQTKIGSFDALIGATLSGQKQDYQALGARGYVDDSSLQNLALGQTFTIRNTTNEYKYAALFWRLNYNFRSKYLISSLCDVTVQVDLVRVINMGISGLLVLDGYSQRNCLRIIML